MTDRVILSLSKDPEPVEGFLYGASTPQALYDETYENYRCYVNPPLARVMKVSGSPVEVRAQGCTIWDHNGKAYLDFAGGYGVREFISQRRRAHERARAHW